MNLQKFIIFMIVGSLLSLVGFLMVLFFINPNESGAFIFLLFYLSLGLFTLGIFTVFGFFVRKFTTKKEMVFNQVMISFRQALWISIVLIVSLYLQSRGLLNWINEILLILALGLIEFFFINAKNETMIKQ